MEKLFPSKECTGYIKELPTSNRDQEILKDMITRLCDTSLYSDLSDVSRSLVIQFLSLLGACSESQELLMLLWSDLTLITELLEESIKEQE